MSIISKKILYVITKSNFGGAQRYVFDLAKRLPKEEFDVVVAFGGTGKPRAETGALNEMLQRAGVRTIKLAHASRNMHLWSDLLLFFELLRLFKKEHPDVIHLNSSKVGGLGALVARLLVTGFWLRGLLKKIFLGKNLPATSYQLPVTIFTVHGFAFSEDRPLLARLVIRFLSWLTVALTTHTILITKAEYERVRHWPLVGRKAVLIPNGIAPLSFLDKDSARQKLLKIIDPRTSSFLTSYQLPVTSYFWIGSIAELHKNKGLQYLIEATAKFKIQDSRFKIIIIGEGDERRNLETLIKKSGLEETVFLAGFVENAAEYLKAFDIFVLPSLKEGLPYVLLEAGMAQLPIIATNVGGMPDIVKHEITGLLIPSSDPAGLATALSALCDTEEQRSYLGKNAAEAIGSSFAVENMLGKTTRLYEM